MKEAVPAGGVGGRRYDPAVPVDDTSAEAGLDRSPPGVR
jgi:hypothetical protein